MVSKARTQAFSGGFCAEKSVGSVKDLSKLSSTLQHLFITSDWAIGSEDILVGSCVPSYLKAGFFRNWRGYIRRLINEKTTWSPVTPFFLIMAIARRMASTCLSPGPLLDQLSWTWGTPVVLSGSGDSKFPTWNRISSIRLLDPPDHKPSTRLGSQGGVPIHIPRRRRDWWH